MIVMSSDGDHFVLKNRVAAFPKGNDILRPLRFLILVAMREIKTCRIHFKRIGITAERVAGFAREDRIGEFRRCRTTVVIGGPPCGLACG